MNNDDLMRMLDIKPENVDADTNDIEIAFDEPVAGTSSYALAVDKWDIAQGEELSNEIHEADLTPEEWTDFHSAYYHMNPILDEDGCLDADRYEYVESLLETPEYHALHTQTQSNNLASKVAAISLGKQWSKLQAERQTCEINGVEQCNNPAAEGKMGSLIAASQAVQQAQERVDEINEIQRMLGSGSGAGDEDGTNNGMGLQSVTDVWNRIKNNARLRRILNLAGRYRRCAQAKQRTKQSHGYDDMVGVELAGEISRLLPIELSKLADEDFELDALRRLVEKQSMCREYRGIEKQGKGPIVVCVDESSSMDGDKIAEAKAFALAMAWVAKHQKRWIALVSFAVGSTGRTCVLPPNKWDQEKLLIWLSNFMGGGTKMTVPYKTVPFELWESDDFNPPKGKTDMIVITDGVVNVGSLMANDFNEWRERENVRSITLIIGNDHAGDLRKTSDEVHNVSKIGLDEGAVQDCFTI